jgi:hypothetical protein
MWRLKNSMSPETWEEVASSDEEKPRPPFLDVVFKTPLLFVVGDTEGHDKLCGHFLSRTNSAIKSLCRCCNVDTDEIDEPRAPWSYTLATQIAELTEEREEDELNGMSYHLLDKNAFTPIEFCDPDRGINGASLPELLHVFQHGLFLYALASIFGQKRALKRAKRKKKTSSASNKRRRTTTTRSPDEGDGDGDGEGEAEVEEGGGSDGELEEEEVEDVQVPEIGIWDEILSVNGIFTASYKEKFDSWAKIYGRLLQHQSDRTFARAYFPSGITKNSKKHGHEERLVVLLVLLIFVSKEGKQIDEGLDGKYDDIEAGKRTCHIIQLMDNLLLLENWLRQGSFTRKEIKDAKRYMPIFLEDYKKVVARKKGMGMKFVKYHLPLHIPDDMLRFGPPTSFDSSTGEAGHVITKDAARRTQKRSSNLESATAQREGEYEVIDSAYYRTDAWKMAQAKKARTMLGEITDAMTVTDEGIFHITNPAYIVKDSGLHYARKRDIPKHTGDITPRPEWVNGGIQHYIVEFIRKEILPNTHETSVKVFTEMVFHPANMNWPRENYRAHPLWDRKGRLPWYDWAEISWRDVRRKEIIIPAMLLCYIQLPTPSRAPDGTLNSISLGPESNYHPGNKSATSGGNYAFIFSLENRLGGKPLNPKDGKNYLAHQACSTVSWSKLEQNRDNDDRSTFRPVLRLVPIEDISGPAVAVPYDIANYKPDGTTLEEQWLLIEGTHQWQGLFKDEMDVRLRPSRRR